MRNLGSIRARRNARTWSLLTAAFALAAMSPNGAAAQFALQCWNPLTIPEMQAMCDAATQGQYSCLPWGHPQAQFTCYCPVDVLGNQTGTCVVCCVGLFSAQPEPQPQLE